MKTRGIILSIAVALLLFSCKDKMRYQHTIDLVVYHDGYHTETQIAFKDPYFNEEVTLGMVKQGKTYKLGVCTYGDIFSPSNECALSSQFPVIYDVKDYKIINYEITRIEQ